MSQGKGKKHGQSRLSSPWKKNMLDEPVVLTTPQSTFWTG